MLQRHIFLATIALATAAGCTVEGKWNLTEVEPTAAVRDIEFAVITLQKDGTYYAERNENGIHTTSGTYRFDGKLLVLNEHGGETMTFDAELAGDGRTLRLSKFWKDQKVRAEFEKKI